MRNMSFMLTTNQIHNRSKTVTRRLGWWFLEPGDMVMACIQTRGLQKGEKVQHITPIRILSTRAEILNTITPEDVEREGFPGLPPDLFVIAFCQGMRCSRRVTVNRIEFEYAEPTDAN